MMPKATVDRTPPPLFRSGLSALAKVLLLASFAILLMVLDVKLQLVSPVRAGIATALTPLQWLAMAPVRGLQQFKLYWGQLEEAQNQLQKAQAALVAQAARSGRVEHLEHENQELRQLLAIRGQLPVASHGVEALYSTSDSHSRKLVVSAGAEQGIQAGAPVMDGYGVLGQVTRVYPWVAEVTLLTDREQAIPVLNARTGQRSIAYGLPRQGLLELRFIPASADLEVGDLLTTNGTAGIYPSGLPVARVKEISRQGESGFAQVLCEPMAQIERALHLLVLDPVQRSVALENAKAQLHTPISPARRPKRGPEGSTP